ncbi:carbohydrate-binding family 9-like protein [Maribacter aestuarii]|uniref:carbohydrate-binding family 9-like protein n=1 Tax=Maribacter aestuarii TaxID=1130723 RepID=UPI0025A5064D|nr:carbohydrate-binding family 9-like protein [Maribacter aestuarii]
MKRTSLKTQKILSVVLFLIHTGCISLLAQYLPKSYIAQNISETLTIDGNMHEEAWQKAKWSEIFRDIEGDNEAAYQTRFKMVWDQTHLYIIADIKEPHVWATLKQKDTIIFYNNDFEVFIDPDGDTHNYYELEVNALNTIWDLFLSKPYRNNGKILGAWDFKRLKSEVKINGTLNNPSDIDQGWMVEMAIPWSFVTEPGGTVHIPKNEFWRMNFSRVNWDFYIKNGRYSRKKDSAGTYLHEHNWVWSPQGVINMHEPEHWGYVYFSTDAVGQESAFEIPQDEHIKWYLYELYRDIKDKNIGKIVWNEHKGRLQSEPKIILGKAITTVLEKNEFGSTLWTRSPFTNKKLVIHDDGKFETYDND